MVRSLLFVMGGMQANTHTLTAVSFPFHGKRGDKKHTHTDHSDNEAAEVQTSDLGQFISFFAFCTTAIIT